MEEGSQEEASAAETGLGLGNLISSSEIDAAAETGILSTWRCCCRCRCEDVYSIISVERKGERRGLHKEDPSDAACLPATQ